MTEVPQIRFLLIEDDEDHARLIARSMTSECNPNEVLRIADGEEALNFIKKLQELNADEKPRAIILDIKIPKVSGLELLKKIKSEASLKKIPVVIFSTSDNHKDRQEAYANSVNSYLVKPLDFHEFRKVVHEMTHYWGFKNII